MIQQNQCAFISNQRKLCEERGRRVEGHENKLKGLALDDGAKPVDQTCKRIQVFITWPYLDVHGRCMPVVG